MSAWSPSRNSSSPSLKRMFEPQPAISSSCVLRQALRRAARRARMVSIVFMRRLPRSRGSRQLLGDVDPDRAPGDAAAAADAARAAELVVPGAELVRQPLAVARAAATAGCCRRGCTSGRPRSTSPTTASARRGRPSGRCASSTRDAEAGRADERAVAAGEAARRRRRPSAGARGCARAGRGCRWRRACRPIRSAAPVDRGAGRVEVGRLGRPAPASSARTSAPRSLPTSTRKRCSPSRISVSARS